MNLILKRNARPIRPESATHQFAIGEAVQLKGGFGGRALTADIYHITRLLPARGDSPQYRIRNDEERHERVTTQDTLEPVRTSNAGEGSTLMERTFGHGQRTETQQPGNQETEAGKGSAQA